MNVNNILLFPDGIYPAIYFPVGLPEKGGSCAFLTEHCLEYCPSVETNKYEIQALEFFKKNNETIIINKILQEIKSFNVRHIYWFPWGDCLPELTEKIINIIIGLKQANIIQNGFTRNEKFFNNVPFNKNIRIGFHLDSTKELKKYETINKIFCIPDVDVGKAELYYKNKKIARCCGVWCEWLNKNQLMSADCQKCYIKNQGCFYKNKQKIGGRVI
jgi:hypothetical protein